MLPLQLELSPIGSSLGGSKLCSCLEDGGLLRRHLLGNAIDGSVLRRDLVARGVDRQPVIAVIYRGNDIAGVNVGIVLDADRRDIP